jgi:hypothetical protein
MPLEKTGGIWAGVGLIVAAASGFCGTFLLSENTLPGSKSGASDSLISETSGAPTTHHAEQRALRHWDGTQFSWPDPGESLLKMARTLRFGFARSQLLREIIKNMPPEKAGEVLLFWDRQDIVALGLLTARVFSDPQKIAPSVLTAVFSDSKLTTFALKCLPESFDRVVESAPARDALIKILLNPVVSIHALKSRAVIDRLCKTTSFHADLFKALCQPGAAAQVPAVARDSLFKAFLNSSSPELAVQLDGQTDSYLARMRASQGLREDLLSARRSVDEVLFESGSSTTGRELVAQALWKITKSDPERAVNSALNSKDPQVSSELAFRLWTAWLRATPQAATAAAAAKGHPDWVQRAADGAYFDEGP